MTTCCPKIALEDLTALQHNIFKIGSQIFPFIFAEYPQGQTDNGPQMNDAIAAAIVLTELMNLGVTVVTAGDAIVGTGGLDLFIL